MLRALLWKEWRQLRALRLAGLALGLVLPIAFLAGASAARRGFAPFGRVGGDSTRTILLELLPATLAFGLWPLTALLVAAQAFAGDRAAGVEAFLLERPVSRRRTWLARLFTSLGSTLAIAAGTGLLWALFSWADASPSAIEWSEAGRLLALGGLLTGLAFAGAIAAAAVVAAPLSGVLLGLLLSLVPVGLAFALGSRFPLAAYRGAPLGLVLPWLLVPAFFLASYLALCRGEPAGRGRALRFGVVLGATVGAVLAVFLALAPILVRLDAGRLTRGASVVASATAPVALVTSDTGWGGGGGWIVDVGTGEKKSFLPPPVYRESAWSRDGKTVAIVTASRPLGGVDAEPRVDFLDSAGRRVGKTVRLPGASWWEGIRWAGDRVVLRAWRDRRMGLVVVDPATGGVREPDLWRIYWRLGLLGPTEDGRLFVAVGPVAPDDKLPDNQSHAQEIVEYTVHRLDVEAGRIDPEPILREKGRPWAAAGRLSPSGRYWLVDRGAGKCDTRPLLDLPTGKEISPESPRALRIWLDGDRLAWLESDGAATWLLLGRPGEPPVALRGWSGVDVLLEASPDRKRLLLRTTEPPKEGSSDVWKCWEFTTPSLRGRVPGGKVPEARVYEVASGRWIDLPWWSRDGQRGGEFARVWAGPRTLARTGPGFFALEDLDRPGTVRNVIGHAVE
jgi:ABC-type transport system involved in multi-copper enzyme maturation permease subunit